MSDGLKLANNPNNALFDNNMVCINYNTDSRTNADVCRQLRQNNEIIDPDDLNSTSKKQILESELLTVWNVRDEELFDETHEECKILKCTASTDEPAILKIDRRIKSITNEIRLYEYLTQSGFEGIPKLLNATLSDSYGAVLLSYVEHKQVFDVDTIDELIDYAYCLIKGIERLHSYGVIHGDLKPCNLFVGPADSAAPIIFIDFAFAQIVGANETLNMELLEFIIKLAKPHGNEIDRYWRLIVNCFLVDRLEQLELGNLPTKFKQYYGRTPSYNGKLSTLVEESEFKVICITVKQNSTLLIRPSEFILRVLGRDRSDPKELLIPVPVLSSNNTNIIHPTNPFAIDALIEREKNEESESETRFGRLTFEELNCVICAELFKEAVESNCCRNVFCLPCIEKNGRKCPNCRILAEWSANEPIRRLVGKKPIKCNYEDCNTWSTVSEIEQHRAGCEFNPTFLIGCQKCQQQIMRRLVDEHLSDTCEMVEVPCRLCGLMVIRKDLNNHETQQCELRLVTCVNGCTVPMTYKMYIDYHLSNCPYQLIKCTNDKCKAEVQRRNLQKHLQSCSYSEVPCTNRARGCLTMVSKSNKIALLKHLNVCDFEQVPCGYGCKQKMLRRDLKDHQCGHVKIKCHMCHQSFKKMHLDEHIEKCPTRLISCPNHCGEAFQPKMERDHLRQCPMRVALCRHGCGKSFVGNAIEEHLSNKCPKRPVPCNFCKLQYTAETIEEHMDVGCSERLMRCKLCQEKFTASHREQHLTECPKRTVQCPKCKERIPKDSSENHLSNLCLKRLLPCPFCKVPQPAGDLQEHTNNCPKRVLKCPQCNERVTGRNYDQHVSEQCRHRPVACPQCDQQVVFSDLTHHVNQVCSQRTRKCQNCHKHVMLQEYDNHVTNECTSRMVTCEKCKSSVMASKYDTHLSQCQKRPCKWCHGYLEPASLLAHENDCLERVLTCPDCNDSFTARNYKGHRNECTQLIDEGNDSDFKRQVSCDKCQELVLASFKSWHDSDMCLERTVECEKCMLPILFKDLDSHAC